MLDSWTRYRVDSQDEETATGLVAELATHGLVLLDDVTSADHLLRLAHSIATIVPHRDSDASGLTTTADIGGQMRSGFAGFSACALDPHTDRSGIVNPPALLMMACGQPASTGGECVVIDGKAVYEDLAESHPKATKALSAPRSVLFGGASGCLSSVFSPTGDRITIRLRLDELAQFFARNDAPATGSSRRDRPPRHHVQAKYWSRIHSRQSPLAARPCGPVSDWHGRAECGVGVPNGWTDGG